MMMSLKEAAIFFPLIILPATLKSSRWPRDWSSDVCSSDLFLFRVSREYLFSDSHRWFCFHDILFNRIYRRFVIVLHKHQFPSTKSQINPNHPNSKQNLLDHLKLEFGAYLGFVIWDFASHVLYIPTNFCFLNSILLRALI